MDPKKGTNMASEAGGTSPGDWAACLARADVRRNFVGNWRLKRAHATCEVSLRALCVGQRPGKPASWPVRPSGRKVLLAEARVLK